MRFWKFDFDSDDMVDDCVNRSTIISPTRIPQTEKNIPNDIIQNKLKVGDGVLLALFDQMRDEGHVAAIGLIMGRDQESHIPNIAWERIKFTLSPDPRGGVAQWKNEACFKFADNPAKRYRLESRFEKVFGNRMHL